MGLFSFLNDVKSDISNGNIALKQKDAQKIFDTFMGDYEGYEEVVNKHGVRAMGNPLELAKAQNQRLNSYKKKVEGDGYQIRIKYNGQIYGALEAQMILGKRLEKLMSNHNISLHQL